LLLQFFLLAGILSTAAEEKNAEQEKAVEAIRQMKGFVERDRQRPGMPVTKVHLFEGQTRGIGLAPLAKLPEIEWIGLHLADITEADLEDLKPLTKLRRLGLADIRQEKGQERCPLICSPLFALRHGAGNQSGLRQDEEQRCMTERQVSGPPDDQKRHANRCRGYGDAEHHNPGPVPTRCAMIRRGESRPKSGLLRISPNRPTA
jgi:hypothetical protein